MTWLRGKNLIERFTVDGYSKKAGKNEVSRIREKFKKLGLYKGVIEGLFVDDHKPPFDMDLPTTPTGFEHEKIAEFGERKYIIIYVAAGSWAIFRKQKRGDV